MKATITITDRPDGLCDVMLSFQPPIDPASATEHSAAERAALIAVTAIQQAATCVRATEVLEVSA